MLPIVALIAAFPAAIVSLTLDQPGVWNDSDFNTLTWTSVPGDPPSFSVDLLNPKSLSGGSLNVLDSVRTADGRITFNLPAVPEGGNYTIVAHPVGNADEVLFTSSPFKIEETRIPNATLSSTGAATKPPTQPTATTPVAGIPQAPSDAPTFPGDGSSPDSGEDDTNSAFGVRPAAGLAAMLALGLALVL